MLINSIHIRISLYNIYRQTLKIIFKSSNLRLPTKKLNVNVLMKNGMPSLFQIVVQTNFSYLIFINFFFYFSCCIASWKMHKHTHDIHNLLTVQPNDGLNAQNYHRVYNNGNRMIFANNCKVDTLRGSYSNGYHPHFRL